ncbi:MAG TPA: hypothetical protein ENJ95_06710 [Bacteroidetes bacterium]|nr:hypothetical protein [Bacteroidota bacterium]
MKKTLPIFLFISISLLFLCCKKEDNSIFPDCELPYNDLELIAESALPQEIVDKNYQTFGNIDSLNAFTLEFCDLGRYLVVQVFTTAGGFPFVMYDECGEEVAQGLCENDNAIEDSFENNIEDQLNRNVFLLDLTIVEFNDGNKFYIAELIDNEEESQYLLEDDGNIICKLF